jgi:hypothetical protein
VATHSSAARPPSRSSARRVLLVSAALAATLTGCSGGFNAQTNQLYQPGPGVSVRQDGVYLINAIVVTDASGHGTLVGALVNEQARTDTLESVTLTGSHGVSVNVTILPGTISLPPHQAVQLANTGAVRFDGTLQPGATYRITMTFRNGAPISTLIPLISKTSTYAQVPLGPVPTGTVRSASNP